MYSYKALQITIDAPQSANTFVLSSSSQGGLMIDMQMNREVIFDPVSQTAYIGSGARLRDVDLELISHGVATPGACVGLCFVSIQPFYIRCFDYFPSMSKLTLSDTLSPGRMFCRLNSVLVFEAMKP